MPTNRPNYARKQARARIMRYEDEVQAAATQAMAEFLNLARQGVLGEVITAAGEEDNQPPNLNNWPAPSVWRRILTAVLLPVIAEIFGTRFAESIPDRPSIQINPTPYRIAYLAKVRDRLMSWPKTAFDQVRRELAESELAGETILQKRDRIGRVLNIDARSRDAQEQIETINKELQAPDLDAQDKRSLRVKRRDLYNSKDEADQLWQPDAVRIARTETIAVYNGSAYDAHTAFVAETGETLYKEWSATDDTRTRISHRIADGQTRALDAPFIVGGFPMQFPGDPTGPPNQTIQCRCALLTLEADEYDDRTKAYEDKLAKLPPMTAGGTMPEWDQELQSRLRGPLLRYWLHGKGAAKIRWGTKGDFMRCVRHIRKYFPKNPKGECANLHHEKLGTWPGKHRGRHNAKGETMALQQQQELPLHWSGVLAPLDVPSGDGRMLATPGDGQLVARPFPLPLMRQPALDEKHLGALIVARIDNAWIENGQLMGEGVFDLGSECGREAARLVAEEFASGVSVDLDDTITETRFYNRQGHEVSPPTDEQSFLDWSEGMENGEIVERQVMTSWRLMSATLVANPAFAEARIAGYQTELCDEPDDEESEMAVIGDLDLPLADREREWDGSEADDRIHEWALNDDGSLDTDKFGWAHFWVDSDMDPQDKTAYKLGFADLIDDKLTAVPRGIFAVAASLEGARGGADIPEADQDKIRKKVGDYYKKMAKEFDDPSIKAPWDDNEVVVVEKNKPRRPSIHVKPPTPMPMPMYNGDDLVAGAPITPPAQWFAPQPLDGPTPLTVTEDGQVFGHLATFDTCHIGYPGSCVRPPKSHTNYAHFNVGVIRTDDGADWPVGKITLGTGHADPGKRVRAASEHYDNTGTAVAAVRAYEDKHGVVVAGALLPDVSDEQIAALRRSPLSGDWRQVGGNLELVAALAVNVPGFAIPRSVAASADERPLSLVAAGALMPSHLAQARMASTLDAKEFARQMLTEMSEQAKRRKTIDQAANKVAVLTAAGRIGGS